MKVTSKIPVMTAIVFLITLVVPVWKSSVTLYGTAFLNNTAQAQLPVEIYQTYPEAMEEPVADPLESYNRVIFQFNDKFYFWVVKPVGTAYGKVVPEVARIGLRNAFHNFLSPARFANNLLQLKFEGAGVTLARFLLNSTFGFAGFYDFTAKQCTFAKEPYEEDFGQTLGHYGMPPVVYIVWPILGPSNFRDTIGIAGDAFMEPTYYLPISWYTAGGIKAGQYLNAASLHIGDYEDFLQAALDPYVAMRNGYNQYRENEIKK
ncbi:MAG: VacJ family lipoprotein [Desulforhabdus sp.]|jgi:phospholipid-binding lipoprotein MlaA|nr:VacJ family lipoprotein [Desulforhabdus sp.]